MTAKELKEKLEAVNPDAIIGFSCWDSEGGFELMDVMSGRELRIIKDRRIGEVVIVGHADRCFANIVLGEKNGKNIDS